MQEVDFKMKNDSCNHFAFLLNGKIMSTKMSGEAIDFLDALERECLFIIRISILIFSRFQCKPNGSSYTFRTSYMNSLSMCFNNMFANSKS